MGSVEVTANTSPIMDSKIPFENRVYEVLASIKYKDWRIEAKWEMAGWYLQITFPDEGIVWKSRKWRLSENMTRSEIAQTALKAVLTAVEHEAREKFLYKGRAIFGPHFNIDSLWNLAADKGDTRPDLAAQQ
jgi:hypothetical protein